MIIDLQCTKIASTQSISDQSKLTFLSALTSAISTAETTITMTTVQTQITMMVMVTVMTVMATVTVIAMTTDVDPSIGATTAAVIIVTITIMTEMRMSVLCGNTSRITTLESMIHFTGLLHTTTMLTTMSVDCHAQGMFVEL